MTCEKSAMALSYSWRAERHRAADLVGQRVVRVEPDGLVAVGQRVLGVLSLDQQDLGPHGVGIRVAGVGPDGVAEEFDRPVNGHDVVGGFPSARAAVEVEEQRRALDPLDEIDVVDRRMLAAPSARLVMQDEPPMFGHDPLAGQLLGPGLRLAAAGPARRGRRQAQGEPQCQGQPHPGAAHLDPSHLPHAPILLSSASFAAARTPRRDGPDPATPASTGADPRCWDRFATG